MTRKLRQPIVQERVISAPAEAVFEAWSDPSSMSEWMCPGPDMSHATVEVDFRVGGRFRIVMHGERDYIHSGEYLAIEPPRRIVFTWLSEWLPADEAATKVSVSIESVAPDRSRIVLVHDELPDTDTYDGHVDGWATILDKLAVKLESHR
jgi:uncharacterized protein YndB with AHSA1/START domain